mmetsp:Transcript_32140/g.44044  ORF Transcript_32140/g.44044 Transcript_32140/m.44044 type:complete len:311 (-) Transcript_32140:110-1042(-)|eukprot:CAMPEP_0201490526 /NCGR_PEP_ID=MMETSP0151_2-20130828/26608_1 /ASSEMBLY_ACC=CAM_ASM_000257 /TAXON_ID=200890 /ORGANISM="Paramoeba atlantica, Strain 621/1 / CCAP 1560/9" /LENGTH=310 /DNA_ID=CAMNT_0047876517 /DNA_START=97 /DNA_END=1029 /DNA_ORIENTATION=+
MSSEDYIPFSKRPEWSDVTPIKQDDGPNPPVSISYSADFVEIMNYFRAIVQKDERSERALALTREVIGCNSANYTAWYFRRLVLEALKSDLTKEFELTEEIAKTTPKNYQLWFHRRWLVEQTNEHHREMDFTASVLSGDSKNYHAWAHRQFVMYHFKLQDNPEAYKKELDYLEKMILQDPRNNSAWNCHFYLQRSRSTSDEELQVELTFVWNLVCRSPNNQSSWSYLRGLLKHFPKLSDELEERCRTFIVKHPFCSNVLSLLVDLYCQKATAESVQNAIELCEKMIAMPSMYQKKYWELRCDGLRKQLEK